MSVTPMRSSSPAERLAARLEDPQVADSLNTLLDHADLLATLVQGLSELVARTETIGETLIDGVQELRLTVDSTPALAGQHLDIAEIASALVSITAVLPKAAPGMVAAVDSGAIDRVLASGIVSPEAVDQISALASGLTAGGQAFANNPVQVGGPLSVLGLLRDPDIKRAVSYFATVGREVGRQLNNPAPPTDRRTS